MPNQCIDAMIGLTKNPLYGGLASIPTRKGCGRSYQPLRRFSGNSIPIAISDKLVVTRPRSIF
jgi:hypothetical protein